MNRQATALAALRQGLEEADANPTPLYQQLQTQLRRLIDQGVFPATEAIPPERELAAGLGLSRITVRKAVRGLVEEGLLTQRQGAGTFVTPRVEQPLSRLTSFTEDMRARGLAPSVKWLDRSMGPATPEEAVALHLSPGTEVARLYRLRSAGGRPLALEQATVPRAFLPDPHRVEQSLYETLAAAGYRPERALQHLRAELLDQEHARLLEVPTGSAALFIRRYGYLPDGRPVEYTRSHYRGDSYDFVAEMTMDRPGGRRSA